MLEILAKERVSSKSLRDAVGCLVKSLCRSPPVGTHSHQSRLIPPRHFSTASEGLVAQRSSHCHACRRDIIGTPSVCPRCGAPNPTPFLRHRYKANCHVCCSDCSE